MRHLRCASNIRWYIVVIVVTCMGYCLDLYVECEALVCSILRSLIRIGSFVKNGPWVWEWEKWEVQ